MLTAQFSSAQKAMLTLDKKVKKAEEHAAAKEAETASLREQLKLFITSYCLHLTLIQISGTHRATEV